MLEYFYIATIEIAFLSSLISFRLDYPFHLKIFAILLGLDFITEVLAVYGIGLFPFKTNNPIYNIFILLEYTRYAWFFGRISKYKVIKLTAKLFMFCFPLFWWWSVFYQTGIMGWNSYIVILGSVFAIFFAAIYCYQVFTSTDSIRFSKHPEFWIATGIIIFYSCNFPYMGMLNYLVKKHGELAENLLVFLRVSNIIMYSIFIYAYLCPVVIRKEL